MNIRKEAVMAGLVMIGAAAGFWLGSVVFAGGSEPGTASDPLVAKSYADEQISAYTAGLEKRVAELTSRAYQLEVQLAQVQTKLGQTPIKPGSDGSSSSSNSGSGSSSTASASSGGSSASSGQKLYIKSDNSSINLRSGPGTGYQLIGTAVRGSGCEPMVVIESSGDWYRVRLNDGRTAWVAGWLVTSS